MCLFTFLNVTTRKFKMTCVAHISFLLEGAALESSMLPGTDERLQIIK